jgi:hypothetical protein
LEKEDRDLLNRIKVFAKMMTKEDFDQFAEGLISKWKVCVGDVCINTF